MGQGQCIVEWVSGLFSFVSHHKIHYVDSLSIINLILCLGLLDSIVPSFNFMIPLT